MSGVSRSCARKTGSEINSRTDIGWTLLSERLNLTLFSQVDCRRSISKISSLINNYLRGIGVILQQIAEFGLQIERARNPRNPRNPGIQECKRGRNSRDSNADRGTLFIHLIPL